MAYWLFKSEPEVFGWDDLVAKGLAGEEWDGVRNYQARNFMRDMCVGDLGFFYHSQKEKQIVGIAKVVTAAHPDSTTDDPRWECVDIAAVAAVNRPVTLAQVKSTPELSHMALAQSPRLSVQPVSDNEWRIICQMADTKT